MTPGARPCPVCGSASTFPFVDRPQVAVHQNLLVRSRDEALALPHGRLWMWCCETCGFAFNAAFDGSLLRYGADYENAQTWSPAFSRHVDDLVEHLVRDEGVRAGHVVEIGCGDGTFLRRLVECAGPDVTATGFDPAYEGPAEEHDGRLTFERGVYDAAAGVHADIVLCRHVIEHLPDPVALLRSVHEALAGSPEARVYFETPCLHWVLAHRVHWDLFYEHCSLFTADALRTAYERAGYVLAGSRHVFGGQYLWTAARAAASPETVHADPGAIPALARAFAEVEETRVARWRRDLATWAAEGPVVLFGAGAKGVTFANLADPERSHIEAVLDINPAKQDRFLPGTGHAIRAPALLRERPVALVLVTNPNYLSEIRRTVALEGSRARVVDLMETGSAS